MMKAMLLNSLGFCSTSGCEWAKLRLKITSFYFKVVVNNDKGKNMIFIRNMFLKKSFNKKSFLTFNLMVKFIFLSVLSQGCQQLPKLNSAVFYQPIELRTELLEGAKLTNIRDAEPEFSWAIYGEQAPAQQVAYQIELWQLNNSNQPAVMWNSGKVKSARSTAISYMGQPLLANQHYQWRVKVWLTNSTQDAIESAWSQPQTLTMANQLDSGTTRYALEATPVPASSIKKLPSGRYLIDFGKSAFGYLDLGLTSDKAGDITVHFGERGNEHGIISDLDKRSSVRYYSVPLAVNAKVMFTVLIHHAIFVILNQIKPLLFLRVLVVLRHFVISKLMLVI